ncbi:lipopolysaccharide biosynthesis protein [Chenggangzhangella methanolivorans]|uniref:Polysaccharide biosynthesis C-terminal domain-containing protein n=1 Tax=Chenggangzhangella methanolivorans TaxID=1437009 RepID=A0A9E6RDE4_9HYPH|nr:polysaccharide biosynthesis C-terminal domain-containing protein [Chenggangzhangella methanolivorans]QZO01269.1 polysaccharide biosynthesis C-terminal domain-containing protein [Chenggangzhangella methanolivorans]
MQEALLAWSIICFGQAIALSNGLWTAAISGLGHVAPVSLLAIAFNAATILAQCAIVIAGGGLTALAVAGALGSLGFRIGAVAYLRRKEPSLAKINGGWDKATAVDLMGPSLKYFLTEVGALLLMKADPYFIAAFLDPASLPVYAANYLLAFNAAVISIAIGDAGNVYVSQLWRTGTTDRVRAIVLRSMRVGMGLMALGAALLLFAGPSITAVWLGDGRFVGLPVMATFSAMLILYTQQSLLFGFSRATEHEVYAGWYLAAGALNIGLSFVLTPTLGLVGVALSTLLAQAATTGWRIPLLGLRRLDIELSQYLSHVAAPIAALFIAACAAIWLVTYGPRRPTRRWPS